MRGKKLEINIGMRVGQLTVLRRIEGRRNKHGHMLWECKCDCGKTKEIKATYLQNGVVQSCGCQASQGRPKGHGLCKTKEYYVYRNILTGVKKYGVSLCKQWKTFKGFQEDYPSIPKGQWLIRKNWNKGYYPSNMMLTNSSAPLRRKLGVELNGKVYTFAELAKKYRLKESTLKYRLRHGYSVERALTEPLHLGYNQKPRSKAYLKSNKLEGKFKRLKQ